MTSQYEVFVDVLCPWCFIGHSRLTTVLAEAPGSVSLTWRSFELDPDLPRTPGATAAELMVEWVGERAGERVRQIRAAGAAEGLQLTLDRARPVNTFDAHRLCHFAADHGVADAMLAALFTAYHTDGRNIADVGVLRWLAVGAGLDGGQVEALLAGDGYAAAVRADQRRAVELGVSAVPSLVVAGGQPQSPLLPPAELRRLLGVDTAASWSAR